ncbi:Aste57867_10134 [Aphanomyces stellatus]|uniref:Aste57867_10134 protein n=1 Tax=Aphanomyces stellatus TaxID=120398 RepID=A0A485KPN9_9STRA|nr:hypothetical protein As57867_010095 [Aphanomyces stellatus]VFT87010.1 Aste57867_10134 [Aphanomyces stellatus]
MPPSLSSFSLTASVDAHLTAAAPETLRSYRAIGRFLLATLATNMLVQTLIVGWQVATTVDASAAQPWYLVLAGCHSAWVAVSFAGGLCGLYSSYYLHVESAKVCLAAWIVLVFIQCCQWVALYGMLASQGMYWSDIGQTLAWESIILVLIECIFAVFVLGYILVLRGVARLDAQGEGICLVEIASCTVAAAPTYGSTTSRSEIV